MKPLCEQDEVKVRRGQVGYPDGSALAIPLPTNTWMLVSEDERHGTVVIHVPGLNIPVRIRVGSVNEVVAAHPLATMSRALAT